MLVRSRMQKARVNKHATRDTLGTPSIREERERGDRIVLIKIPARERNVDVYHPGTGTLAHSRSASPLVLRGPRRWNNFNNKRQSPSQKAAATGLVSLSSTYVCPLRVHMHIYARSHGGGRLSNHFLLLLKRAPPALSSLPPPSSHASFKDVCDICQNVEKCMKIL